MRDSSNLEGNWAIFQSKTTYLITFWLNIYEYEYYFITLYKCANSALMCVVILELIYALPIGMC